MLKRTLLNYFFYFGIVNSVSAQEWHSIFQNPETSYPSAVKVFQSQEKDKPENSLTKSGGEDVDNQFYRWDYMMRLRGANLKPFDAQKLINEYKSFSKNQSNARIGASESWKPVGPFTNLNTYNGLGRVDCIGFHPTNSSIFYIGTPTGGLWKTIDGGISWASLSDNWDFMGVSDIAINPNNPDIIYVATGDRNTGRTPSIGILKSIDGGKTWQNLGITSDKNRAYKLLLDPTNADRVLLTCTEGLRISNDAGKTWINGTYPKQSATDQIWELSFKPNNPKILYAVTSKQFLVSSDGGKTFILGNESLNQQLLNKKVGRLTIAVTPASPENIYLVACDFTGLYAGYFVSQDGGGTFSMPLQVDKTVISGDVVVDINGNPVKQSLVNHFGQGLLNLTLAVSPKNPNLVYIGTNSVLQTSIKADTVILSNTDYNHKSTVVPLFLHVDTHALAFQPGTNELFSGNDGGIYRRVQTTNEWGWKSLGNNLAITQIYHLNASTADGSHLAVGNQDNGFFEYRNGVWANLIAGDGMYAIFDPTNSDYFMMSARCLNIDRKPAKGLTSGVAPRDTKETRSWETPFFLYEPNRSLYLGFQNVWKSSNRGDSWQKVTDIKNNIYGLFEFKISPLDSTQWYVSYYDEIWQVDINGNLKTPLKCFRSSDSGKNWEQFGINLEHFTFHPTNANRIWANSGSKIFQSDDKGKTWKDVSLNFPDIKITTMVSQKGVKNGLWVGAIRGVYYKDDDMSEWLLYSKDLPNVEITDLSIDYATNKLITSTYGRGVWNVDLFKPVGGKLKDFKVSNKVLCKNSSYDLSFTAEDYPQGINFKIQLSGNDGTFTTPTDLITSKDTKTIVGIPTNVALGENYKIRVVAVNYPTILEAAVENVTINDSPKGTLSASSPTFSIFQGGEVTLNLAFTKGLPNWNYELSDGTKGVSSVATMTTTVKPSVSTVYTIKNLNNTCGVGTTDGKVEANVIVVTALENDLENWLKVFPNPTQNLLFVELLNESKGNCELLDITGQVVLSKSLTRSETLDLHSLSSGTYILKVNAGKKNTTLKVIKL
jgi:photosystem II stability/assembly factor-like uncharacterized protein